MAIFDRVHPSGPNLFALPPGRPFFDDLVRALLLEVDGDFARLPRIRLFVPSRRAVRSLKESFMRQAGGEAVLLPRITAVADLDEEDVLTDTLQRAAKPLAPAPSSVVKKLVLARLYSEAASASRGVRPPLKSALQAANLLSQASDQLVEFGIDEERLEALARDPVMENLAGHWQKALDVLKIAARDWPRWLEGEGMLDPRARRAQLLDSVAEGLPADGSSDLVIAAGFLGTSPSSQRFLAAVAGLPRGAVVFPAFDRNLSDEEWAEIEAPHPQSAYKCLLEDVFGDLPRSSVRDLDHGVSGREDMRRKLLSLALMPAEATHGWARKIRSLREGDSSSRALRGLRVAVAATSDEEADFIALAMREVLEEEGRTAFLVTADRVLGRRVASKLAGWGIEVDDSGGMPLSGSYRATFLRLVARVMAQPADSVALAGLIHHQLFGLGMDAATRRPLVQAFDLFLRGRPPREGWDGLAHSLEDDWRPFQKTTGKLGKARADRLLHALTQVFGRADVEGGSVAGLLQLHIEIAQVLAATDKEDGAARLFRFEDGEVLQPHLEQILRHAEQLGDASMGDYPEIFDALLQGPVVRPPGGQHPRLSIFGILEARLQTADLVIVGGLQEGVWPGDAAADPFFSRKMRQALGMPSPEAEIGRVAHDFLDFAAAPNVLLTRSERQGRSPARASRFMVRLESFLDVLGDEGRAHDAAPLLRHWRRARFDHDGPVRPASPPRPAPPAGMRPARLSVSDVGTWLRDPYAIYAKSVLRLRPLAAYGEPFTARHRGDVLHRMLEDFIRLEMKEPSPLIEERLAGLVDQTLEHYDMPARQRLLNKRFIGRGIESFAAFERVAREACSPLGVELEARMEVSVGGRTIELVGRADRVDGHPGGGHIIDYKLGGTASVREDRQYSPQLFLLALMLERGGFESLGSMTPWQISFLRLNQKDDLFKPSGGKAQRHLDAEELREQLPVFEKSLMEFLEEQYRDETPMPSQVHPFSTRSAGDYDELARRAEWLREGGEDD